MAWTIGSAAATAFLIYGGWLVLRELLHRAAVPAARRVLQPDGGPPVDAPERVYPAH